MAWDVIQCPFCISGKPQKQRQHQGALSWHLRTPEEAIHFCKYCINRHELDQMNKAQLPLQMTEVTELNSSNFFTLFTLSLDDEDDHPLKLGFLGLLLPIIWYHPPQSHKADPSTLMTNSLVPCTFVSKMNRLTGVLYCNQTRIKWRNWPARLWNENSKVHRKITGQEGLSLWPLLHWRMINNYKMNGRGVQRQFMDNTSWRMTTS